MKIEMKLTPEQVEKLAPLFDYAGQRNEQGDRGCIYGQPIRQGESDGKITFGFMNKKQHEYLRELSKGK